ncbi:hypothetical protein HYX11_00440 [Candidatus Woesearchaeota archaeon]|nr:hypothetical protein [Candidatus Woesearchaeota archaeon]
MKKNGLESQGKLPTTGVEPVGDHQWHARFARGGFPTMSFPIEVKIVVATPQEMKKLLHFCADRKTILSCTSGTIHCGKLIL